MMLIKLGEFLRENQYKAYDVGWCLAYLDPKIGLKTTQELYNSKEFQDFKNNLNK